ncbi:MAG TPA: CHAD domain-containing protein [Solirubrobacterales bacterium]|nr:CHAD domain-containing protein [Solirubrobacterales bacterium]
MSSEIERKFVLDGLPSRLAERDGVAISQGYLTNGEGPEIRLRRAGEATLLTVKTGDGEVREEVEVSLAPELFKTLWPLTAGRRIAKTRLREPLGEELVAEVDVYGEGLSGLVVAEVEFDSEQRSREFEPPPWLGREVTGDPRYANRELAMHGTAPIEQTEKKDEPSRSFRLKRKEDAGDGLRRIVRGRTAQAIESLEGIEEDPVAAIHSARKDIKKIRSVLRLLRDDLGKDLYRTENRRYRDAAAGLSGSRDAAVKVETLTALEDHFGREIPSASAWGWRRQLERERLEAAEADPEAVAAAIAALRAGGEAVAEWPLDDGSWDLVGPGLERSYRRGRAAMAEVADDPDPELVHAWRKRGKDLWYQLRLVKRAWPSLLGETVDRTHELTDLLGDHHDLSVLATDLASREIGSKARMTELIGQRQGELLGEALALGERLYAEKPKAFGKRVHAYWSAWR